MVSFSIADIFFGLIFYRLIFYGLVFSGLVFSGSLTFTGFFPIRYNMRISRCRRKAHSHNMHDRNGFASLRGLHSCCTNRCHGRMCRCSSVCQRKYPEAHCCLCRKFFRQTLRLPVQLLLLPPPFRQNRDQRKHSLP